MPLGPGMKIIRLKFINFVVHVDLKALPRELEVIYDFTDLDKFEIS